MNRKMILFLILSSLFIAFIMISLIPKGVVLRERAMIKWSAVDSLDSLSLQLNPYLFPLMSQYTLILFDSEQAGFSRELYQALLRRIKDPKLRSHLKLEFSPTTEKNKFQIQMIALEEEKLKTHCQQGEKDFCLGLRSLKKFKSQDRDSEQFWINMFRTHQTSAVLFYVEPKTEKIN